MLIDLVSNVAIYQTVTLNNDILVIVPLLLLIGGQYYPFSNTHANAETVPFLK